MREADPGLRTGEPTTYAGDSLLRIGGGVIYLAGYGPDAGWRKPSTAGDTGPVAFVRETGGWDVHTGEPVEVVVVAVGSDAGADSPEPPDLTSVLRREVWKHMVDHAKAGDYDHVLE